MIIYLFLILINENSLEKITKNFSSIKVESIDINLQKIKIRYNNPELEINNKNFNILYDNMGEVDKIKIEEFPNNLNIFYYDSFRDKKLPIFNDIKVDNLKINYINEKYSCEMIFKLKSLKFTAIYEFINLDFMKSDEILSEINDIKFSNVIIGQNINFEKDIAYKNIKYLYFYDCIIEDEDIFEQIQNKKINNNLYIFSDNTKFTPKKYMNIKIFTIEQEELAKSDKILNYINPFDFIIEISNEKKI